MSGFSPIVGGMPRILILGSMPGVKSLDAVEYYAHPQNAFWWIMSQLFGLNLTADYHQRCQGLIGAGVAVWDVLYDCERPGSLDSNIVRGTEQVNDFADFFSAWPSIDVVGFNGQMAEKLFVRHCQQIRTRASALRFVTLPSTSPANARQDRAAKLARWRSHLLER
ncbi:DNA-deoxyinosine glycosylase [Arenicella chitinivorans]|uniref:DNA-deoxyinosine glycosylase n=1 Tax=Arenicella chitinivorans TaxID=1329800 RepID=A0A918RUQ0_9GAMM|nr:DNA-deoxyinosine glycosylase [Arenicella chitinivorans]GHA11642.1 DNA-deoxyinosine glycosylase [Arenicella chitinivorans]